MRMRSGRVRFEVRQTVEAVMLRFESAQTHREIKEGRKDMVRMREKRGETKSAQHTLRVGRRVRSYPIGSETDEAWRRATQTAHRSVAD